MGGKEREQKHFKICKPCLAHKKLWKPTILIYPMDTCCTRAVFGSIVCLLHDIFSTPNLQTRPRVKKQTRMNRQLNADLRGRASRLYVCAGGSSGSAGGGSASRRSRRGTASRPCGLTRGLGGGRPAGDQNQSTSVTTKKNHQPSVDVCFVLKADGVVFHFRHGFFWGFFLCVLILERDPANLVSWISCQSSASFLSHGNKMFYAWL